MSVVKQYRIIKDIPFQFLQMELKKGDILTLQTLRRPTTGKYFDMYLLKIEKDTSLVTIKPRVVEGWPEYFEPVIEGDVE